MYMCLPDNVEQGTVIQKEQAGQQKNNLDEVYQICFSAYINLLY